MLSFEEALEYVPDVTKLIEILDPIWPREKSRVIYDEGGNSTYCVFSRVMWFKDDLYFEVSSHERVNTEGRAIILSKHKYFDMNRASYVTAYGKSLLMEKYDLQEKHFNLLRIPAYLMVTRDYGRFNQFPCKLLLDYLAKKDL